MTPCINLYPTTACDAKNDNRKQNTIASYAMKKFGIEYQGFLLRFCTHRNYFNCVFRSTKLRKYAIRSLIWSYAILVHPFWFFKFNICSFHRYMFFNTIIDLTHEKFPRVVCIQSIHIIPIYIFQIIFDYKNLVSYGVCAAISLYYP